MTQVIGGLEFPYVPPGYTADEVYRNAMMYAQSRRGYQPHMVMQEGHIENRGGVEGVWIKFLTPQGTSTEFVPLSHATPPAPAHQPTPAAAAPAPGQAPAAPARVPDAQNPGAVSYAQRQLARAKALGFAVDPSVEPTAEWRAISGGIASQAREKGYLNPRDYLAGRPRPGGPRGPGAREETATGVAAPAAQAPPVTHQIPPGIAAVLAAQPRTITIPPAVIAALTGQPQRPPVQIPPVPPPTTIVPRFPPPGQPRQLPPPHWPIPLGLIRAR